MNSLSNCFGADQTAEQPCPLLGTPETRSLAPVRSAYTPAFIGFDDEESDFIAEAAWLDRHFGDRRFSFRTNSQPTQAAAARAGYGIALLPRYIVAAHEPDLVQVSLGVRLPERDVWLLVRRDLRNVPRVRAVTDYLIEIFQRERRLLKGN